MLYFPEFPLLCGIIWKTVSATGEDAVFLSRSWMNSLLRNKPNTRWELTLISIMRRPNLVEMTRYRYLEISAAAQKRNWRRHSSTYSWNCWQHAFSRVGKFLTIETVFFPFSHVVFDIFSNQIHFFLISDYVIMKTGLPCKYYIVFFGKFGNGWFKSGYYMR